jgi:uncharacterized protein (TIGR00266 family)
MSTWYLSFDGKQEGPFDAAQARTVAQGKRGGFAWREGFTNWLPIDQIGELSSDVSSRMAPPPLNQTAADEIDFKICGSEMQFVEIELDPGEGVVAEAGAMMYKDPAIAMNSVFGDGRAATGGFMQKLVGAGKRLLTGESLFMTVYSHSGGNGKARAAFAAPYPGNIIPVSLSALGGQLICQKDSFLCAAKGVSIGIFFQKKILTALFGGEGFIMQKLEGDGLAFLHAGGTIVERNLTAGEVLQVDTGCVVAFQPSVDFSIEQAGNIKSMIFGGEGLFVATLRGPGTIWLQSLPFSRLAGRMMAGATRRSKDEGSLLGGVALGSLLGGDE